MLNQTFSHYLPLHHFYKKYHDQEQKPGANPIRTESLVVVVLWGQVYGRSTPNFRTYLSYTLVSFRAD